MSNTAFARLRDSIRAIASPGQPPSAYRQTEDPPPSSSRRSSLESANADPDRSGSRLGFVKVFRRTSSDLSRSQAKKEQKELKELEAQRVREERRAREQAAKELKEQERQRKHERVKAQRAAEHLSPPPSQPLPQPLQTFQQPTLSTGSMSSPSLLNDPPRQHRQANPPLRIRVSASSSASHLPLDSPPASPTRKRNFSPPPIPKASENRPLTRHPNTSAPTLPSSPTALRPTRTRTPSPTPQIPRDSELQTLIQAASRTLLKHLLFSKPLDQPMSGSRERQQAEIEARLRSLARLEHRYWRDSASPNGPVPAGDERERRYFADALRDGYLLCVFMNVILPSRSLPLKPSSSNVASNMSRFLTNLQMHFQADPSVEHIPAFLPDDLGPNPNNAAPVVLQAYWDGLKRVANCIIAMGHLREMQLHSRQGSSSPTPASRPAIYQRNVPGSMSSPDLTFGRAQSPVSPIKAKRMSPPSPKVQHPQPEPSEKSKGKQREYPRNLPPSSEEVTNRTSVSTNGTSTTYLSSLFTGTDRNYGTVKTMATDLTSASGGTNSKSDDFEETPRRRRRVSEVGMPVDLTTVNEAETEEGGTIDLKIKVVNHDNREQEGGEKIVKHKPSPLNIFLGKGKFPDDFVDVFSATPPDSPLRSKSGIADKGKGRAEENEIEHVDLDEMKAVSKSSPIPIPLSSRRELSSSSPGGSPRRPLRLRRPSAGSPSPGSSAIRSQSPSNRSTRDTSPPRFAHRVPIATNSSASGRSDSPSGLLPRPREPSTSSRQEPGSPLGSAFASTTETSSSPHLVNRRYSANASIPSAPARPSKPSARYDFQGHDSIGAPRDRAQPGSPSAAVPFPRRASGEHQRSNQVVHPSVTILPALPSSTETLPSSSENTKSAGTSLSQKPRRPPLSRGRFQSEDLAGAETLRFRAARQVEELEAEKTIQVTRPRTRERTESMVNLGAEQPVSSMIRDRTGGNGNGVRMTVTLKEPGEAPVHYQLGNCIGRGQFGTVYRALNLNTGQTVAVKRISLVGLSDAEITQLMNEVELLKRLSHPSIVKYEGMSRDSDTLSIVLEYVENGSLFHTLKAFGRLNERLVASYVVKILEGLHYLHQSQVVHCDLKSANILTTKNGNVKLSDFGVSLNLRAMENIKDNVAGTPNWMAPEIIELKGASPASDIWSLGCTVVELLTGKPPYSDIANAMTVMFRIVDDARPPLPENCSGLLRDFLLKCFQKDPSQRPSAEILFEHPWLKLSWGVHKDLRPQDSLPFLRRVSAELQRADLNRPYANQAMGKESPERQHTPLPRRISSDMKSPLASPEGNGTVSGTQHTFVKTHFSKAVLCRVCETAVKGRAVLCQDCSFIAHTRCIENAPGDCDLRLQLQMLARYSQEFPSSPPLSPPPVEHSAPPVPAKQESTPILDKRSSQSGLNKIFSRKKSKPRMEESPTPPTPPNPKSNAETRRTQLFSRTRTNRDESKSRNSMGSEPNSSSLRSARNRASAFLNGKSPSPSLKSAPLPTPPPKPKELPPTARATPSRSPSRLLQYSMEMNPSSSTEPRGNAQSPSPDDQTYVRRRKRLTKTESQGSKSSGCTTQ